MKPTPFWFCSLLLFVLLPHKIVACDEDTPTVPRANGDCGVDTSTFQKWSQVYGTSTTLAGPITISGRILMDLSSSITVTNGISVTSTGWLLVDWNMNGVTLTTSGILVNGKFQIGSSSCPFTNKFTINLQSSGNTFALDGLSVGTRLIGVGSGGVLDFWGAKGSQYPWTSLNVTAQPGATQISVADPVAFQSDSGWKVGDQIVIATSDWSPAQTETFTISSIVDAYNLRVSTPLAYSHFGNLEFIGGRTVDQRAEVGLLTRNIVVMGGSTQNMGTAGHMIFLKGHQYIKMQGVELFNMGQSDIGRYPIHFHLAGDSPNSVIRANSIRSTNFRCVVVHASNYVTVSNNVAYDHKGHCMYLEDGVEYGNVFDNNLVLNTKEKTEGQWLASDKYPGVSGFWITNANNTFTNNVVGGSVGAGYWLETRLGARGLSASNSAFNGVRPTTIPLKLFSGNTAHSCDHGMQIDATGFGEDRPANPQDPPLAAYFPVNPDGSPAMTTVDAFTAHHNRFRGFWSRLLYFRIQNSRFTNNFQGIELATNGDHTPPSSVTLESTTVVGFSSNKGSNQQDNYQYWDGQRSQPRQGTPWVGMVLYDGPIAIKNCHFDSFSPSPDTMPHTAIGARWTSTFQMATTSYIESSTFNNVARRTWVTDRSGDGGKTWNIRDTTGSITSYNGATVLPSWGYYTGPNCVQNSLYGLACPHQYSQLWVLDMNSPGTIQNPVTLTRNEHTGTSHSGYSLSLAGFASAGIYRYQADVSIGASYLVQFQNWNSKDIVVQLNNAEQGESVTLALCYPPGTTITRVNRGLANWLGGPNLPQRGSNSQTISPVGTRGATSQGDSYWYDSSRGLLVVTLRQRNARSGSTNNFCPDAGCEFVWVQASGQTAAGGDCFGRAYTGDSLQVTSGAWMGTAF